MSNGRSVTSTFRLNIAGQDPGIPVIVASNRNSIFIIPHSALRIRSQRSPAKGKERVSPATTTRVLMLLP